jgi:hypothetical protein
MPLKHLQLVHLSSALCHSVPLSLCPWLPTLTCQQLPCHLFSARPPPPCPLSFPTHIPGLEDVDLMCHQLYIQHLPSAAVLSPSES